jgi:CheY-like chemotaxis protein
MKKPVRIFLVDDNEIDLVVNEKLLLLAHLADTVVPFSEAPAFLERVAGAADLDRFHNVLLLDIMMPGMNGFECATAFAALPEEITRHFQVFVLSSSIDRNDIRRADEIRIVQRVLEKPLDAYILKGLISQEE